MYTLLCDFCDIFYVFFFPSIFVWYLASFISWYYFFNELSIFFISWQKQLQDKHNNKHTHTKTQQQLAHQIDNKTQTTKSSKGQQNQYCMVDDVVCQVIYNIIWSISGVISDGHLLHFYEFSTLRVFFKVPSDLQP